MKNCYVKSEDPDLHYRWFNRLWIQACIPPHSSILNWFYFRCDALCVYQPVPSKICPTAHNQWWYRFQLSEHTYTYILLKPIMSITLSFDFFSVLNPVLETTVQASGEILTDFDHCIYNRYVLYIDFFYIFVCINFRVLSQWIAALNWSL